MLDITSKRGEAPSNPPSKGQGKGKSSGQRRKDGKPPVCGSLFSEWSNSLRDSVEKLPEDSSKDTSIGFWQLATRCSHQVEKLPRTL